MKKFTMVMWAGLLITGGCDQKAPDASDKKVTSEEVRTDARQAAGTAVKFSQQSKEEFQASLHTRLKELDAEITKLRVKGQDLKDQAKANWDQKLVELESKRDAVRAKLAEVSHSTAEAWKDAQQGAQAAWDELDRAFRQAASEFK
jgi:TolA-binding protein